MKDPVLISVITPCFNSEATITQTIESMLRQTWGNYEYILIDGGSTDQTVSIIQSYLPRFGGRMRYISEKDRGIYDAMNKGIRMAKGSLIGIVNSDDYYEPDCLQSVAEAYDPEKKYSILYGEVRFVNQQGEELYRQMNHHRNIREMMILHPASFVSAEIYRDFFLYDTQYRYSADLDFLLKASDIKEISFTPIYKILTNFRVGGASYSRKAIMETYKIRYKYGLIDKSVYLRVTAREKIKQCFKQCFRMQ